MFQKIPIKNYHQYKYVQIFSLSQDLSSKVINLAHEMSGLQLGI